MRDNIEEGRLGKLGVLLVLQLVLGYGLACGCFLLNIPLGGWQFWLSALSVVSIGFWFSRTLGLLTIGLNALAFLLTLYTFTYSHCDASICHLPMSHFLVDGWNPVRESSFAVVKGYYQIHGIPDIRDFDVVHVLVDPKFSQILAAQYQSAFGLFTAAAYPLWLMTFALGLTAYRFARAVWSASPWMALAFAVCLCSNPIIFSRSLRGLVDLVTYDALVMSALSLVLWARTKERKELCLFFPSLLVAYVSKFTGLGCGTLLLIAALVIGWRDREMRIASLLFFVSTLVFFVLPYWTSAYWHGSPFYPAHTFRHDVPVFDLTDDFAPYNEAAAHMGVIGRLTYAWVSRGLATWACGLYHGMPSFDPQWGVAPGIPNTYVAEGECGLVMLIFWGVILSSFFVRRNHVSWMGWLLLLSCIAIPPRYIGFTRYVSQVFAAIVLLAFNGLFAAPERFRRQLLKLGLAGGIVFLGCDLWAFWSQLRDEGIRQQNMTIIARSDPPYQMTDDKSRLRYLVNCYLAREGGRLSKGPSERNLDSEWHLFPRPPCDESGAVLPLAPGEESFVTRERSWIWGANDRFPSPLWQRSMHIGHDSLHGGQFPDCILQPCKKKEEKGL